MADRSVALDQRLAGKVAERGQRPVQAELVVVAAGLLLTGLIWLGPHYSLNQAALFMVGAGCGLVLYHAAFGFTTAFRVFVSAGDGRGLRAQMLMMAVATLLFAPMLASGTVLGRAVSGAVAPAGLSVLAGAFIFSIGMQLGGG
jgi:hypothetical protein